jgi:hypothetical protein
MRIAIALTILLAAVRVSAQGTTPATTSQTPTQQTSTAQRVTCTSKEGERIVCPADTSAGVVLVRSTGAAPCLLGKTWGYDNTSIWVSDGCAGEFVAGQVAGQVTTSAPAPGYVPNLGSSWPTARRGRSISACSRTHAT